MVDVKPSFIFYNENESKKESLLFRTLFLLVITKKANHDIIELRRYNYT